MNIFKSESELIEALNTHDDLVFQCAEGKLDFAAFSDLYDVFYWRYALDGHESNEEELRLLVKHKDRIETHRVITETIFGFICSDEDADNPVYVEAGRFGSKVAQQKLVRIVETRMKENAQQGD